MANGSSAKDGQVTYRVLQCTELDLTTTLSSLSDGWIFEQVTSLKNTDVNGANEFLLVLSRRSPTLSQINLDQGDKVVLPKLNSFSFSEYSGGMNSEE